NIHQHLYSSNKMWTELSKQARTIAYSTERVKSEKHSTCEALAYEQYKGRLCQRSYEKVTNESLVAAMLEAIGEEKTTEVIQGWLANLATPVFADDTALLQAIDAGQCDVGIVNSYYFGRLHNAQPDVKVKLFWPNQEDRGVHVNISGAG